jgi:hypothetical protein
MKKYAKILVAVIFFSGLGVAAQAETQDELVVKLPFQFLVGGKTLPAGTYKVSRNAVPRISSVNSLSATAAVVSFRYPFCGTGFGCSNIHDVPKRSRSIAKRCAKKVSSIFMNTSPPSFNSP